MDLTSLPSRAMPASYSSTKWYSNRALRFSTSKPGVAFFVFREAKTATLRNPAQQGKSLDILGSGGVKGLKTTSKG